MSDQTPNTLHHNAIDLMGQRFARLVVTALAEKKEGRREVRWLCRCDCGNEKVVAGWRLTSGNATSCGCWFIEQAIEGSTTHGFSKTKTYKIWGAMKRRCLNPKDTSYQNYGARGIRVCDRWLTFENFLADMGEPPKGMSLDRIDANGDYCPGNCRWASKFVQANNKRNNVLLTFEGRTQTVPEWGREVSLSSRLIHQRLRDGWTVERILTTPLNERAHQLAEAGMRRNGGAR